MLIIILYFNNTLNCDYKCDDYFEHLSKAKGQSVRVFEEKPIGQLVISGKDDTHQVEIYILLKPSKNLES